MANNNISIQDFSIHNNWKKGIIVLVVIYFSGLIGLNSVHADWFLQFTPLNLIISAVVVMLSFKHLSKEWLAIFGIISFAGYLIEVIGVNTGWPFGSYQYGDTLGIKLFGVPLIIGINWGVLIIASTGIANYVTKNSLLVAFLGAGLMVLLDFVIEPVAIHFDFWNWDTPQIPISNYIAWYLISFVLILFVHHKTKYLTNRALLPFYIIQFCFFAVLSFTI